MTKEEFIAMLKNSDKFNNVYANDKLYWVSLVGSRGVFNSFNTLYCQESDYDLIFCGIELASDFSKETKIDDVEETQLIHYTIDNLNLWTEEYLNYLPSVCLLRICQYNISKDNLLLLKEDHKKEYEEFISKLPSLAQKAAEIYLKRNYDRVYKWATRVNDSNYHQCAVVKSKNYYYLALMYSNLIDKNVDLGTLDLLKSINKDNKLEALRFIHRICEELINNYNLTKSQLKKDPEIKNIINNYITESFIKPRMRNAPNKLYDLEVI